MNEFKIFNKSIKDYFTKEMLTFLLFPLFGSAIVLYIIFFSAASFGLESLEHTQIEIQQHETNIENGELIKSSVSESYTGYRIIDFLLKYTITSWIMSFLVYTIGLFVIGYLSIFISLIIIGFLAPKILAVIHKKHYKDLEIKTNFSIIDSIFKILKTVLIMIVLFIVLIPFYFIPLVNLIALNLPFYYFFHKMLHFDIASSITSKEQYVQLYYNDKGAMRARTMFLYTISLVPFVAFFISVFYIIYLGHVYFTKLETNRY